MSISASVEHSIPGPVFVAVYRVMKTVENGDADRLCSYLELAKLGKAAAFPAPLLSNHRELALFRAAASCTSRLRCRCSGVERIQVVVVVVGLRRRSVLLRS
jgi:hypothetical protein